MSRVIISFNVSELSSEFDDDYICPICMETYYEKEIYQCKEGHCSCKECWIKSLENKKECMQCKIQVNSFNEVSRVRQIEKFLLKTDVCCPYSFKNIIRVDESEELIKDGSGCNKMIKLGELDDHIENCGFRFVECEGCMDIFRYNQNKIHISKCEYQYINCKHCSKFNLLKTMEQHYFECPSFLIDCFVCNEKIKRGKMSKHINKECQEVVISCKFSQLGCNYKIKRKNLENHLDQINHTKQLYTAIECLSSSIEHLIIKNNQLSNSINELTKGKEYKNKWIVSNYSKIHHNVGDSLESPTFGYDTNLFEIRLYKNGKNDEEFYPYDDDIYTSIFLQSTGKQKNITFSITLLNKNPTKNHTHISNGNISTSGFGWEYFIKRDEINKENGYVTEDDKVEFEFTITYPNTKPLFSK
ncbi:hypothetical protein DICPUDRAFT_99194 [Dictyostelium purpureum]|uniref:TRAF-type domain-containing protein n=1 Tax=Dictyostelium purpureum TaxID=5786 RepID=F0ZX19_DICPU|nr:uncharacterized protein DICPUDRAFT_99194 [Dictyostelium purpureum]EGC31508.1 hypothetical protein DICPUDRAFT_99194 [Dictyostelium purpureum]|eukprot:XP_003291960.1 hypothetical protein DICPUDRAFT_99194 [Dictyostelium purpureum]